MGRLHFMSLRRSAETETTHVCSRELTRHAAQPMDDGGGQFLPVPVSPVMRTWLSVPQSWPAAIWRAPSWNYDREGTRNPFGAGRVFAAPEALDRLHQGGGFRRETKVIVDPGSQRDDCKGVKLRARVRIGSLGPQTGLGSSALQLTTNCSTLRRSTSIPTA